MSQKRIKSSIPPAAPIQAALPMPPGGVPLSPSNQKRLIPYLEQMAAAVRSHTAARKALFDLIDAIAEGAGKAGKFDISADLRFLVPVKEKENHHAQS